MGRIQQFFFAQKAFILHDSKLLLVKKSAADPNQPGLWEVPGGRMQFGENPTEHIIREVKEEVGISINPGIPFYLWDWRIIRPTFNGDTLDIHIVAVARLCEPLTFELSDAGRVEDDWLDETRWVSISELAKFDFIPNMIPVISNFIELIKTRNK